MGCPCRGGHAPLCEQGTCTREVLLVKLLHDGVHPCNTSTLWGHVAEWLRTSLQNLVPRFNSGRGLQKLFTIPQRYNRFEFLDLRFARVERFVICGALRAICPFSSVAQR